MSETIGQNVYEFSAYEIGDDEIFIEENKVMVTSGLSLTGDGCLEIEGMVYIP